MCFLVKYALFIVNFLAALTGLGVIVLGIIVLVFTNDLTEIIPVTLITIPVALIVIGVVIFLIAFSGCCGAIKESTCLLSIYVICMLLLAAGNTYIAVVIFSAVGNIRDTVIDWLSTAFNNNNLREPFHVMELAFRCCGTTGADSYIGVLPQLPPSCCSNLDAEQVCTAQFASRGCNTLVGDFFESYMGAVGGVVVTIIIIELAAVLFGFGLCLNVRNKRRKGTF